MAYNDERSYLGTFSLAAANVVATASGQIVAATTVIAGIPIPEPTFLCSIAFASTATPSAPPAGVKPYVLSGTTTSTGTGAITVTSAAYTQNTFVPSPAVAGAVITIGLVQTGTASGTMTAPGGVFVLSFGPQYV